MSFGACVVSTGIYLTFVRLTVRQAAKQGYIYYIYLFEPFIVLAKQSTLRGRSKMSIDLILPSIVLVLVDFHLNKSQATLAKVRSSLDSKISISQGAIPHSDQEKKEGRTVQK